MLKRSRKTKLLAWFLSAAMVLSLFPAQVLATVVQGDFASGGGTEVSPYLIASEADLRALAANVNGGKTYSGQYFKVTEDIVLQNAWTPIGTAESMFQGHFDGQGHTISGMTVSGDHSGLFAYIGSGAEIQNVRLTEFSVSGKDYLAGLVAHADAGDGTIAIEDCCVSGTTAETTTDDIDSDDYTVSKYLGGIVAYATAKTGTITISACTSRGTYSCDDYAGGIVGYGEGSSHSLSILNCTNYAYINGDDNSDKCGGIAGNLSYAMLENCMNYGSVYGNGYSEDNGSSYLSGIAGSASSSMFTGCGNYGSVTTFFAAGISSGGSNTYISCLNAGKLSHSSDGYGVPIGRDMGTNSFSNCYFSESGSTYYFMQDHSVTGTEITASSFSACEAAYYLKDYFGMTIGVDAVPVPKTLDNLVCKVTVTGAVNKTYYVNVGSTVDLPVCAIYDDGTSIVDSTTPIARDLALIASNASHTFVDGVCSVCDETESSFNNFGRCGENALWSINANGVLTIYGSGDMTDFADSASAPWYTYGTSINTVVIEKGITSIGDYAFSGSVALTSITGGESLISIGDYSFNNCDLITSYTVPANVKYIGSNAFSSCDILRDVILGDKVETIGDEAFANCIALYALYFSENLVSVGSYAFYGCSMLNYIRYLDNLESIGSYAFAGCTAMEDIQMGTVKTIGDHSFSGCTSLSYITFTGNAPESIDSTAFQDCEAFCVFPPAAEGWVDSIMKDYGGTLTWVIGAGVSGNISWVINPEGTLVISGSGTMYDYSDDSSVPWYSLREQINAVVINDGVTNIGDRAFSGCTNLTSISIPESVSQIGTSSNYSFVFLNCNSLKQISIPKSVTVIGPSAFANCSSLSAIAVDADNSKYCSSDGVLFSEDMTSLCAYPGGKAGNYTIPASVTTVGKYAFYGSVGLTDIELGSISTISYSAFSGCTGITEIIIPASVKTINDYAFSKCTNLTQITFLGSAPTISSYAFSNVTADVVYPITDTSWTSSNMKNYGGTLNWETASGTCGEDLSWELNYANTYGVLTISGSGTMYDFTSDTIPWKDYSSSIKTIVLPDDLTTIGDYAFYGCSALTSISIPDNVTYVGNNAFYNCTVLKTLSFGSNVKTIGDYAFYRCSSLTSIVIPDSVTFIGSYAFFGCSSVSKLTLGDNVTSIGSRAFKNCKKIASVMLPDSITTIGTYAFQYCYALKTVDLGSGITSIGDYAFDSCTALSSIVIPKSVSSVGTYAFRSCSALTEITFEGDAPSIGSYCFGSVTVTAYYPAGNSTWTSNVKKAYGGTIKWIALCKQHVEVVDPAVEPTCTESGLTKGSHCSVCNEVLTAQETVAALGHDEMYHDGKAATCIDIGWDVYETCSRCDYSTYAEKSALGHTEEAISGTPATCTAAGLTAGVKCCVCGETITAQEEIPALGHSYGITETKEPTCTEYGQYTHTCSTCGNSYTENFGDPGHDYQGVITASTCTEQGYTTYTCTVCGDSYKSNYVDAKGHTEVTITGKAATCTEAGLTDGLMCSACGKTLTAQKEIPIKGHSYDDGVVAEEVSCTAQGVMKYTCSACDHSYTEKFGVPSHSYDSFEICTRCGEEKEILPFRFEVSKVKGLAGDVVELQVNMAGNPGIIGACMELTYDAEQLTLVEVIDTGLLDDSVFSRNLTDQPYLMRWEASMATENNVGNGTVAILKFQISEDCEPGKIPVCLALNEDEIYNADTEVIEASSVNGYVEVLDYVPGDANGDGKTNSIDVTLLRRYLAKWEGIQIHEKPMDVNGDGKVNSLDVTILRRYLAGWPGYSLVPSELSVRASVSTLTEADPLCFLVSDVSGAAGEEVTVTISMENNPGIIAACMELAYDHDKLELLAVTDEGLLKDCTMSRTTDAEPFALRWEDSLSKKDNREDGVIATLTFRLLEDCEPGETAVKLSVQTDEVYDASLNPVAFAVKQADTVEAASYDAATGTVTLNFLPVDAEVVFIAAYADGKQLGIVTGTPGADILVPMADQADKLKIFYLGKNFQPVDEECIIEIM